MKSARVLGNLWDHEETVRAWVALERRGGRYARANQELVEHAAVASARRILDVGAGTGGTARACLARLARSSEVLCVEPAAAMREAGVRRVDDPRVRWSDRLPTGGAAWDRILCGAAIWQLHPLDHTLRKFARLLCANGALVFTIPSTYLGEADTPGGGPDPWFAGLLARLSDAAPGAGIRGSDRRLDGRIDLTEATSGAHEGRGSESRTGGPNARTVDEVEELLHGAGFTIGERWRFRHRLSVREYAAWLQLPPVNEGLLGDVPVESRARQIEAACLHVDTNAWRWERWVGWTVWKR